MLCKVVIIIKYSHKITLCIIVGSSGGESGMKTLKRVCCNSINLFNIYAQTKYITTIFKVDYEKGFVWFWWAKL